MLTCGRGRRAVSQKPKLVLFFCTQFSGTLHCLTFDNREQKSLRHVAIVAKCLDDNKPKHHFNRKWICTVSKFIDLI